MRIDRRVFHLKRIGVLLALALLLCMLVPSALAKPSVPARTEQFYVGDFANVLDSSTVETIVRENEVLFNSTGAEIAVVTVDFLDGEDIADYAMTLFNEWGVGSAERDNGVLLLLAIGEDNYHILQGKGVEDSLSSGLLGDLLAEYLEPDFAAGNYDAGVRKTFAVLLDAVKKVYPSTGGTVVPGTPDTPYYGEDYYAAEPPRKLFYFSDAIKAVAVFVVIVIVVSILGGSRGRRRRRGGYYYAPPPPPPPWRGPGPRYRRPPPPPPPGFFGGFGGPPRSGGGSHWSGGGSSRSGGSSGRSSGGGFSHGGSSRSGGGSGRSSGGGFSHGGSSRGGGAGRR